jgi:hypothetical protein
MTLMGDEEMERRNRSGMWTPWPADPSGTWRIWPAWLVSPKMVRVEEAVEQTTRRETEGSDE